MISRKIPNCNRFSKFERYEKEQMRMKMIHNKERNGRNYFIIFVEYNPNEADFFESDVERLFGNKNERVYAEEQERITKANPENKRSHATLFWQFFETQEEAMKVFNAELEKRPDDCPGLMGGVHHWQNGEITGFMA